MRRKSGLTAIAAAGMMLTSAATYAAPIVTISAPGSASDQSAPLDAESEFLASLEDGAVTETFDEFATLSQSQPFYNAAGKFSVEVAGASGCARVVGGCAAGVAVLDAGTSIFNGRYAVSGDNWLDSMDAKVLSFAPLAGVNAIGFFMSDAQDSLATLFSFSVTSGGTEFNLGALLGETRLSNGVLNYLAFTSTDDITNIRISNNHPRGDGFGIDNLTVGRMASVDAAGVEPNGVPEPGTMALLGLGLLGTRLIRRRQIA